MKAICVDDEALLVNHLVSLCRELPPLTEAVGFTRARDALAWLRDHDADLAILDIDMPDMSGMDLAKEIRKMKPEVAIIFLTGYAEFALQAFDLRVSGYLLKPVTKERLAAEVAHALADGTTTVCPAKVSITVCHLLTMAAGLTTQTIRDMAGGDYPVARIMPNTPCAIGAGVVQLCCLDVTEVEREELKTLLSGAGLVDELDEGLIDAACAVSGCGPAFAYLFLDALAQGGISCGLSEDKALLYAAKMLEGAAKLAAQSDKTPEQLKQAVCSPGGATIQGVHALERAKFPEIVAEAVKAAYRRTLELK